MPRLGWQMAHRGRRERATVKLALGLHAYRSLRKRRREAHGALPQPRGTVPTGRIAGLAGFRAQPLLLLQSRVLAPARLLPL
jgi:hypothetical protein